MDGRSERRDLLSSHRAFTITAQRLNVDLQSLLEVDLESQPSNKKVTALQAQLVTAQNELETLRRSHAIKVSELDRKKALYDVLKPRTEVQAQSNKDWQKRATSLQTKLEAALTERATMSAAI